MDEQTMDQTAGMTLLERREIEAAIVGPLMRAFIARFGDDACREVLTEVIRTLARSTGEAMAKTLGRNDLEAFAGTIEAWKAGGALEMNQLDSNLEVLNFDVTRCRYAEMYRRMGLEDLGATLSCLRDFELVAGFNEGIELERTQTLMQGASHCDFRFRTKPRDASNS